MKFETFVTPACCGKTSLRAELGAPITPKLISLLVSHGFTELMHFTKAGIMYLENSSLIVTGPIGSTKIQIKCKHKDCTVAKADLENYLLSL